MDSQTGPLCGSVHGISIRDVERGVTADGLKTQVLDQIRQCMHAEREREERQDEFDHPDRPVQGLSALGIEEVEGIGRELPRVEPGLWAMPIGSMWIQHIQRRLRPRISTPEEASAFATRTLRAPSLSVSRVTAKSRRSRVMADAPMKVIHTTL